MNLKTGFLFCRRGLALAALLVAAPLLASDVEERTANDGQVVLQAAPEVPAELIDSLRRYQNVRSAAFQAWSEDGSSLFVSTRFAEVTQLHRVDTPGGARHQLTFFDEPVRGTHRRPGSRELVFTMDEGGSEFFQIFGFDPADGSHRRLTDGVSRNGSPSFSRDGERMAYLSTRRNGSSNDVWVMDVDRPESARLLVEAPDGTLWIPGDWSPDGRHLLILNYVSITDSRIHVLDLESGDLTLVAGGGEKPASFLGIDPQFSADGSAIFLASDDQGEFRRLFVRSLADGTMRPLTDAIDWDVVELVLNEERTQGVFETNEDGVSRLYLLDTGSLTYRPLTGVPQGVIGRLEYSPDGERMAMTLSTSQAPSDVFTLDIDEGTIERWTHSEVGGLDTANFVEPELVHYPTFDGRDIPAFVYRPAGEGPHPVVVSIHGGPEGQFRPRFNSTIQTWAGELGVAVVAPNVRGSSGYGKSYLLLDNGRRREDSVKDIGALLDWIGTEPDLDGERVAVYGGSYGGYMVLASLVHYSERLRAAAGLRR